MLSEHLCPCDKTSVGRVARSECQMNETDVFASHVEKIGDVFYARSTED